MALVVYFRGERIRGRVIDVYNTDNDIGVVVEADDGSRYAVNFSLGKNLSNLYGLLAPQRKNLEKLSSQRCILMLQLAIIFRSENSARIG
jgi:hypothetical protein